MLLEVPQVGQGPAVSPGYLLTFICVWFLRVENE